MKRRCTLYLTLGLVILMGCRERRSDHDQAAPVFAELAPTLKQKCAGCHGAKDPAAGYSVYDYLSTTRCTSDGQLATKPASTRAPILTVLSRPDHERLLSVDEKAQLTAWVEAGAPQSRSVIHPVGILDPRSPAWHGALAATDNWAPLRDPSSNAVCGRCHAGSPLQPADVTETVPGAPSCTSCHDSEAGVLDCATCHGADERAYPPRDACLFEGAQNDAHRAHLTGTRFRETKLACDTCHQVPSANKLFSGVHANGSVDVRFDSPLAGAKAAYDEESLRCSVGCHDHDGTQAEPSWDSSQKLDCNSCHQSPPDDHYPGECSTCHREMGKTKNSLQVGPFHLNGKVDVGNGDGTCGACHGDSKTPWPRDASHRAHRDTKITESIACSECHAVPEKVTSKGHLDGKVSLLFSGRALRAMLVPSFDADGRTCSEVACHGTERGGRELATPIWGDTIAEPDRCSACHATPPPPPHTQRAGCGGGLCHGNEVAPSATGYSITESGRARHLDGVVKTGAGE